jgi:hypothetical protein
MPEELLVDEIRVGTMLSLRPGQVKRMANRGELPTVELPNGQQRFDPAAVRAWVQHLPHGQRTESETK